MISWKPLQRGALVRRTPWLPAMGKSMEYPGLGLLPAYFPVAALLMASPGLGYEGIGGSGGVGASPGGRGGN